MTVLPIMAALQASDEGLTLMDIVSDIPHDAAAIVIYALIGFCIWFVVRAGRSSGGSHAPGQER